MNSNSGLRCGRRAERACGPVPPAFLRIVAFAGVLLVAGAASAETWRGLTVAPESRCSPYERKRDYRYPPSVEDTRGLHPVGYDGIALGVKGGVRCTVRVGSGPRLSMQEAGPEGCIAEADRGRCIRAADPGRRNWEVDPGRCIR